MQTKQKNKASKPANTQEVCQEPQNIKRRKQLACTVFNKKKKSLCSKKISLSISLRIFNALIASIFLYNSGLWHLLKRNHKKLTPFEETSLDKLYKAKEVIKNTSLYTKMQNRTLDYTHKRKKTQMVCAHAETSKRSACKKSLGGGNKKTCEKR